MDYDLFFDESGVFEEASLFPEADKNVQRQDNRASQIVGVLAPSKTFSKLKAKDILSSAYNRAGLTYTGQVHGTDLSHSRLNLIIQSVLEDVESSPFQIVRMLNKEHIGFGNSISTYTNLIAQFVVRVFEELEKKHGEKITLSIIPATRVVPTDKKGVLESIYEKDYRERLTEYLSYVAVRRGLAKNAMNWKINKIKTASARKESELQIYDLLSNASFNNFNKLKPDTKSKMRSSFANYDFSLYVSDTFKEVETLYENGSVGMAVNLIAEAFSSENISKEERGKLNSCLKKCIDRLKDLNASARDLQLTQIDAWLRQLLDLRKNLSMIIDVAKWIDNFLAKPISLENEQREKEIEWFVFSLHLHMLTAFNHRGDLAKAREHYSRLESMFPKLAGQWEYAPLMMEGLIHQAVHQTDCFEFKAASHKMRAVADYYGSLSELFKDALPDYFPERVKSRLRGMALGTCLQNESFASLSDPSFVDSARKLSNMAIDEFSHTNDKERQFQYRCQIETFGGRFAEARHYLAISIGAEAEDYHEIINTIVQLSPFPQGFALLHCSRIAAEAVRQGNLSEVSAFYHAFKKSSLSSCVWFNNSVEYPAHGILRALTVVGAYLNDETFSMTTLNKLISLLSAPQQGKLFHLIVLCGWAETAAFFAKEKRGNVKKIIERGNKKLLQELSNISKQFDNFPEQRKIAVNLYNSVKNFIESDFTSAKEVITAARLVGY